MAWCHSNVGPRSFLGGLAFLLAAGALSHAAPLPKGELKGKPMPTPVAVPLPPVAPDVPAAPLPVPMPIVAVPAPIAIQVEVEEPAKGPDLQKKIDDALKELDKLDKADPNAPDQFRKQLDDVRRQMRLQLLRGMAQPPRIGGFGGFGGGRMNLVGQGRLGAMLQKPPQIVTEHLNLPTDKGLMVTAVFPDTPAEKAGFKKHDIVLEFAGKEVTHDITMMQKLFRDLKADKAYDAVVMRKGQKETIKGIKVPEADDDEVGNLAPLPALPGNVLPGFPQGFPNIQIVPGGNIQIPNLPFPIPGGIPGGIQGGGVIKLQVNANGNGNESMKVQVVNDDFSVEYASGALKASLKGTREAGKTKVSEIRIQDDGADIRAAGIDQVPDRYRATLNRMLDAIK